MTSLMTFSHRRVVKSRTIKCLGFVTRRPVGEKRNAYRLLVRKSEGTRTVRLGRMREDIVKILKKYDLMCRIGLIWHRLKLSGGLL